MDETAFITDTPEADQAANPLPWLAARAAANVLLQLLDGTYNPTGQVH